MRKMVFFSPAIRLHIIFLFALVSCNNIPVDVPFPPEDSTGVQPVTKPLHFSGEKKLNWVTVKTGGLTPVIRHFDPETIPSRTYDSADYIPFTAPPAVSRFDWNSLPGTALDIDKLPAESLQFKTSILAPPVIIKAGKLLPKEGTPFSVFEVGAGQGINGKVFTQVFKDKKGFIWISSDVGLYRYDGENVQVYTTQSSQIITGITEDKEGRMWYLQGGRLVMLDIDNGTVSISNKIPNVVNNLTKMIVDGKGRLWINNITNKGLAIVDPVTKTFKHLQNELGNDFTFFALEDHDKNIWISTTSHGLGIIDGKTGTLKFITKATGLAGDSVLALGLDKKGRVWATLLRGSADAVDIKAGVITHYGAQQGVANAFAIDILLDKTGRAWMSDGNEGFLIIDGEKGYTRHFTKKAGITSSFIISLAADDNGRVWFATNSGLAALDNAEETHLIDRSNVSTMLEGPPGNIWIGLNRGIEIFDVQKKQARYVTKAQGLSDNNSQSFTLIDGNIWITSDGGLDIYDPIKKTMEHTGKKEGLAGDTIYNILRDKTGTIWLTGPSNGIDVIDAQKTSIKHAGKAQGLDDEGLTDVKQDKNGLLWLATVNKGVDVINPVAGTVKYLTDKAGLQGKFNRIMTADSYGRMWIGTGDGVYVADVQGGTLTHITVKQGLPDNRINCMNEYNGSMIVSTTNKVCIITMLPAYANKDSAAAKWVIKPLYKSEALIKRVGTFSSNIITATGQYLWGDFGLTVLSSIQPDTTQAATYITGLQLMNQPQYFVNHPHLQEKDTLYSADTFYTRGQTPVNAGFSGRYGLQWDSVAGPYNTPVNLVVPYNQNYLQFHFAEASWGRRDSIFYSYILLGIDKQWSALTNNTVTENYLSLPPGSYTFKVRSKGLNGEWGQPAVFSFTITPPWFKTWWAYTLYVLIVLLAISLYVKYRSKKLQAENILLEQKIKQRTEDLQRSIEDLKTTQAQLVQSEKMASLGELTAGIAHEIQNPLNFVTNFSEMNTELIAEMKEEIAKGNMTEVIDLANNIAQNEQKINHHGRRADAIVKGMLQHSRASAGLKEPTQINALADEYLRLSYHGLRAKDKGFNATMHTDFESGIGKINIIPQEIGRVLLNLFNNAFYAITDKKRMLDLEGRSSSQGGVKAYQPTVSLTTKKSGDHVIIIVSDNGNGVPQAVINKIFQPFFTTKPTGQGTGLGLSLSYDIIKAHGGEIKVDTKEGEGTAFTITLPLH